MRSTFYLDHNATTPMCEIARLIMADIQRSAFGNASSLHWIGRAARHELDGARTGIAGLINCEPGELYFTSGGTEANNWIVHSFMNAYPVRRPGLFVSSIEHKSMLRAAEADGWDSWQHHITVSPEGVVSIENLERAIEETGLEDEVFFVSVMMANNETGVIQPIEELVNKIRTFSLGAFIHVDAVQAFGKMPVDVRALDVDAMTLSAHKVSGPKGVGALYMSNRIEIEPLIRGGHQEGDLRAGTENVAGAAAFWVAARERYDRLHEYIQKTSERRNMLEEMILSKIDIATINGADAPRLPNTSNIRFEGLDGDALAFLLSNRGVAVSSGSACEAGQLGGSHVLQAMGLTEDESRSALRFSFGAEDYGEPGEECAIAKISEFVTGEVKSLGDVEGEVLLEWRNLQEGVQSIWRSAIEKKMASRS